MFNYSIEIRRFNTPMGKLVAMGDIIIDDIMRLTGFKVFDGTKGLFVSPPSHKGKDKDGNEKYFDDILFLGEPGGAAKEEISKAFIDAYLAAETTSAKTNAAKAQVKANETAAPPKAKTGKLW